MRCARLRGRHPESWGLRYIVANACTGEPTDCAPVQQWKLLLAAITTGFFIEGAALLFLAVQ